MTQELIEIHVYTLCIPECLIIFENFRGGGRTPGTPFLESAPGIYPLERAKIDILSFSLSLSVIFRKSDGSYGPGNDRKMIKHLS